MLQSTLTFLNVWTVFFRLSVELCISLILQSTLTFILFVVPVLLFSFLFFVKSILNMEMRLSLVSDQMWSRRQGKSNAIRKNFWFYYVCNFCTFVIFQYFLSLFTSIPLCRIIIFRLFTISHFAKRFYFDIPR